MTNVFLFIVFLIVVIPLTLLGIVVASAAVAQNWRFIVYLAGTMFAVAVISAACHHLL